MRHIATTFFLVLFSILPAAAQEAVTEAVGQAAGQQQQASFGSFIIFWGVILGIFYFILIRPQKKRAKEHRELIGSLGKGDEVVTSGGIIGRITAVHDTFVELQIAKNTVIKVTRYQIASHRPKKTAAPEDSEKE